MTPQEFLKDKIPHYTNVGNSASDATINLLPDDLYKLMHEYRMRGNNFTPDEIIKIQEAAYDAGLQAQID